MPTFKVVTREEATRLLDRASTRQQFNLPGMIAVSRGNPPRWAIDFIKYIISEEGYTNTLELSWYTTRGNWTSGRSWKYFGKIHLSAGRNLQDQTYCILHELAHLFAPPQANHDHSFWKECFRLTDKYGHLAEQFGGENCSGKWAEHRAIGYKPRLSRRAVAMHRAKGE